MNRTTREIREIARGLLEDPAYQRSLRKRLIAGKAGPIEPLMYFYAYGRPKEEQDALSACPELTDEERARKIAEVFQLAQMRRTTPPHP